MTDTTRLPRTILTVQELRDLCVTAADYIISQEPHASVAPRAPITQHLIEVGQLADAVIGASHMGHAATEVILQIDAPDTCAVCGAIAPGEHTEDCAYHPRCWVCGTDAAEVIGDTAMGVFIRHCSHCDAEWEHRLPTDETITRDVASALTTMGLPATYEMMGGNIWCVLIREGRTAGIEWIAGMANETWMADLCESDGNRIDGVATEVPSVCPMPRRIAAALFNAIGDWRRQHGRMAVQS